MYRFWNDGGGDLDGDGVDSTAECFLHRNTDEQGGREGEMARGFNGCKGATTGTRLAEARIERDVLDIG